MNQAKTLVQVVDAVQNKLYTLDRDLHHPYFINDPPEYVKYGLEFPKEEDFLELDMEPQVVPRETTVDIAITWVKGFQDAIWGIYKWKTIVPPEFFKLGRSANEVAEKVDTWKTVQNIAEYLNLLALQDGIISIRENPMLHGEKLRDIVNGIVAVFAAAKADSTTEDSIQSSII
ncbi:hypothetical protein AA313_de0208379 [Arthrobotrys entomopaga]|nr:hypothetical protein AA313_de0208379 [Arthrobotrys entomopaga]